MIEGIFDSHAHYDDNKFDADRDAVFSMMTANKKVSGIIDAGCDVQSSLKAVKLSKLYDIVYAAVGIQPSEAENLQENWLQLISDMLHNEKVIAVGEIGLDYHWETPLPCIQKQVFEAQLVLAQQRDLPVIVHSRDATADTLELLKKHRPNGVLHCFSGSVETAHEILDLGMYIGFTGVVTFKNARKSLEVAADIPLDRILLETDCPYMAPEPFRGKRTTSDMIEFTAAKIAEIRGMYTQDIIDIARDNTKRLFKIK